MFKQSLLCAAFVGLVVVCVAADAGTHGTNLGYGIVLSKKNAPNLSVYGFEMGKPLSVPTCPTNSSGLFDATQWHWPTAVTCREQPGVQVGTDSRSTTAGIHFLANEQPVIVSSSDPRYFTVSMLDGKVSGISIKIDGVKSQGGVYDIFQRKYGKPQYLSKTPIQNIYGARFEAIHAQWNFANLMIIFSGVDDSLVDGSVWIVTPEFFMYKSKQNVLNSAPPTSRQL